jgi:UDP-glucose 4-epimerase
VPEGAELVVSDVKDIAKVLTPDAGYDGLVHFAAKSLVGESGTNPELYWDTNVAGSLAVLQAMKDGGVPRIVFSSSAATYGQPEQMPITEDTPTAPTNAYGASKLAVDHMLTSFASAHGLGCVSLRYFNVAGAYGRFGERHATETHLIPIALQVASAPARRSTSTATTTRPTTAPACATTSTSRTSATRTCSPWAPLARATTRSSTSAPAPASRSTRCRDRPPGHRPSAADAGRRPSYG